MFKNKIFKIIAIAILVIIIFSIYMAKKSKIGNTINRSTEKIIDNILNTKFYNAKLKLTVSDVEKNIVNEYEIEEKIEDNHEYEKIKSMNSNEITEIEYKDNNLKIKNNTINLEKNYENYNIKQNNYVSIKQFIELYNKKENSKMIENDDEIILETTNPNSKRMYNQKLYINKKTEKPTKIVINNSTGKEVINIKYNDIEFKK